MNAGNNYFHRDTLLYGHKHEQHAKMIGKAIDFSKAKDTYGLLAVIGTYTPGQPAVLSKNVEIQEKRMRQSLCDNHRLPVVMFSYPCMKFFCKQCYEESFEKSDVYALNELELPVARMWASLNKYIDGGHIAKVE